MQRGILQAIAGLRSWLKAKNIKSRAHNRHRNCTVFNKTLLLNSRNKFA